MQRWLIGAAVVAGVAVVAILLGMRAQVHGGAMKEADRISLHREREPKTAAEPRATTSPLLTGGNLDARLRALHGHPVVLNAWASWCPPCREELPLFASAATRFGHRVAFLGADVEDDAGTARRLLAEIPLGYPSYTTDLAALQELSSTAGTPFTVYLNRQGEVVDRHIGAYRSQSELDAEILRFLSDAYRP